MDVIFLDVDGVLNNDYTKEIVPNRYIYRTEADGTQKKFSIVGADPVLVKRLLDWASKRDIHFVLSSTWRLNDDSQAYLIEKGLDWLMVTPEDEVFFRGKEIQVILDYGFIDKYAILDDFPPEDFLPHQRQYLVQTSPKFGLSKRNLEQLDRIFYGQTKILSGSR